MSIPSTHRSKRRVSQVHARADAEHRTKVDEQEALRASLQKDVASLSTQKKKLETAAADADAVRGARVENAKRESAVALQNARREWARREEKEFEKMMEKRRPAIKAKVVKALEPEVHRSSDAASSFSEGDARRAEPRGARAFYAPPPQAHLAEPRSAREAKRAGRGVAPRAGARARRGARTDPRGGRGAAPGREPPEARRAPFETRRRGRATDVRAGGDREDERARGARGRGDGAPRGGREIPRGAFGARFAHAATAGGRAAPREGARGRARNRARAATGEGLRGRGGPPGRARGRP